MSFKKGDYLTTKHGRTRTVYKCLSCSEQKVELETILSPFGIGEINTLSTHQLDISYRVASKEELLEWGVIPQSMDFIKN